MIATHRKRDLSKIGDIINYPEPERKRLLLEDRGNTRLPTTSTPMTVLGESQYKSNNEVTKDTISKPT